MLVKIQPCKIIDFNDISKIEICINEFVLNHEKYDEFVESKKRKLEEKLLFKDSKMAFLELKYEAFKKFGAYIADICITIKNDEPLYIYITDNKDFSVVKENAEEALAAIEKKIQGTDFNKVGIIDLYSAILDRKAYRKAFADL